jgi:hypothetical protein
MELLSDRTKLAFDYARDSTKQLMTLATGVVALTVTFSKEFIGTASPDIKCYVNWSWILLLISVGFGQFCLMALTGILGSQKQPPPLLNIYAKKIKITSIMQVLTFFTGLLLAIIFAVKAL